MASFMILPQRTTIFKDRQAVSTCHSWKGRAFIFAPSWAALDSGLVSIHVTSSKVQALSSPLLFWLALDQDTVFIVDICLEFPRNNQFMHPGFRTAEPFCRPFRVENLHFHHENLEVTIDAMTVAIV